MAYTTEELGRLIARAHYQAWRLDAPPFDLTPEELAAILPNLIKSGSAGIVWHRVKPVREKYGAMAYALEAATEAQIAHNQRVEEAVVECVIRLRAYGIEPVLVKGLALAKLYPEGIVRPAGDIDLVVRKDEYAAAFAILHDSTKPAIPIDIDLKHPGIWDESQNPLFIPDVETISIDEHELSVIMKCDALYLQVLHLMKHDGQRPVWACDIALIASTIDANWRDRHRTVIGPFADWVPATIQGISALLDTSIHTASHTASPPTWFQGHLLRQWWKPKKVSRREATRTLLLNPGSLPSLLVEAWPSPAAAVFCARRPASQSENTLSMQLDLFLQRLIQHLQHNAKSQLSDTWKRWLSTP